MGIDGLRHLSGLNLPADVRLRVLTVERRLLYFFETADWPQRVNDGGSSCLPPHAGVSESEQFLKGTSQIKILSGDDIEGMRVVCKVGVAGAALLV